MPFWSTRLSKSPVWKLAETRTWADTIELSGSVTVSEPSTVTAAAFSM